MVDKMVVVLRGLMLGKLGKIVHVTDHKRLVVYMYHDKKEHEFDEQELAILNSKTGTKQQ